MNKAVMLLSLTLLGAGCAARSTDAPGKHVSHRAHSGPRANPHAHRGGHGCSHKSRHKGYKHHTVHHSFADAERWAKKFEDPARADLHADAAARARFLVHCDHEHASPTMNDTRLAI